MSMKDSWLIVQATDRRELWGLFQLDEVRTEPQNPQFGYVDLPGGWTVLWGGSDRFHGRRELLDVSRLGLALRLHVNDQVTYSSTLTAAKDRKPLWELVVGEDDALLLKGSPPLGADALRALTHDFREQMGGDHDVPLAVAKSLTGFDIEEFFDNVSYLQPKAGSPLAPPPPGRLRRWIGRPLWKAIKWWSHFVLDTGERLYSIDEHPGAFGSFIAHTLLILFLVTPFVAAFLGAAWLLGTILRFLLP